MSTAFADDKVKAKENISEMKLAKKRVDKEQEKNAKTQTSKKNVGQNKR